MKMAINVGGRIGWQDRTFTVPELDSMVCAYLSSEVFTANTVLLRKLLGDNSTTSHLL